MTDSLKCIILVRTNQTHRFCLIRSAIPPGHRGSGPIGYGLVHLKDKNCQFVVRGANLSPVNSIVESNPQFL